MQEVLFNKGITEKQIEELIGYSNSDELVRNNTNDTNRFANTSKFEEWMQIPREIFTLTNNSEDLLGLIWFRNQAIPDRKFINDFNKENFGVTFAIRIYGKARSKGYSEKFLNWAFHEYKKTNQYSDNPSKGVWLETRRDNFAAIKLYEKFGFRTVTESDETNRIIMIQS